eukprot:CAMPEP_0119513244 /NCGR_PEP_ID=MMETSP1344-20130328/31410_1 /TAXON_ID=236787 /ORGANISM="Florenciella parvula, Strain CCMP2471" /LENGTH=51 /DNA_ID=CAMNT_0007550443 /DNA_START=182 /DNA_END=333 /DNA_ORIENTATION=+
MAESAAPEASATRDSADPFSIHAIYDSSTPPRHTLASIIVPPPAAAVNIHT